ncbi:MAG TPA: hypothetical protein VFE47_13250 [Tepidisphaeraceae bacterium]|nr:hypothetical protein [Tepidisphaeraceae bacterium]
MLLQTNSYIVPKERRAEHARLIRRFRQALARIGCDQFEVYEQVGANWSPGGANGRYVQIMRFRDRHHQQAVQAAERQDHGAQHIIAEFCELINFPYQQQHGYFATGFYTSVLPVGPRQAIEAAPIEEEEAAPEETVAEAGEWHEAHQGEAEIQDPVEIPHSEAAGEHVAHAEHPAEESVAEEQPIAELPQGDRHEAPELPEEISPEDASAEENEIESTAPHPASAHAMTDEEAEAALLAEETPAQIAAEAAVADVFLDTIAEEHPPAADMGGRVPASGTPALSADEQVPFAEAPIAPAVVELPPEEELVTADIFVPHDANAEPAEEALDFGEVELPELSATESESLEMPAEATDHAPPAQDASHELHEAGLEDVGLDFTDEETTLPAAEHQEAAHGQPGEQGEPMAESAAGDLHAAELGELGLEFDDELLAPEPSAELGVDAPASAHPIAESESPVEFDHADHQAEGLAELPIENHETGVQPADAGPANEASADLSAGHETDAVLELPDDHAAEIAAELPTGHADEMHLEAAIGEHSSPAPSELPIAHEPLEPGLDFAHAEHAAPAAELPAHTGEEAALDSTGELLSSETQGEPAAHAAEASGEHGMGEGLEFHEVGHAEHAEAADVHPGSQVSEAGLEFADAGNASGAVAELLPAEDAVLAQDEPAKHDTSGLFADEDLILGLEPRHEEAAADLPAAESHKGEHTPEEHTPEVHTPGEMGLEFGEPAHSSTAPTDSASHDALHDAPLHGLDDADHAIQPQGEHAAPAEAAAAMPIDLPLLNEPLAHEGPAVSAAPDVAPAIAEPAETFSEEFSLDEGLIFDEDELPSQGDTGQGDMGPTAHSDAIAGHDDAHLSAHDQGEAEPLLDSGGLPEEDGFDSLLDDTNMLVHAPASDNGHAVPANHADRQSANVNASEAPKEKDPDLLEFEAFLRQLDEGSGKLSN